MLAPSARFRVNQYLKYLEDIGYACVHRPSIPNKDFSPRQQFPKLYKISKWLGRIAGTFLYLFMFFKRVFDVLCCHQYDIVFFQRELYPFGPPVLEYLARLMNKNIIFDFDDAIFLGNEKKISDVIRLSRHVIAGNAYLYEFAKRYNSEVTVIPTVIDTDLYKQKQKANGEKTVIGYVGSPSTLKYLELIRGALLNLREKYKNLEIMVVSAFSGTDFKFLEDTIYIEWSAEQEVDHIGAFDIGIMPLKDDEWSRGKCGAKLLQYMSVGIPAVASRVGVNPAIIENGINGFLASDEKEWIESLSCLIENTGLRKKMGVAARQTVERSFSVKARLPELAGIFQKVMKSG